MENQNIGDCTAAAVGHAYQIWTANAREEWTPTDGQVGKFYSATTGYDPKNPATDQGGIEIDVLSYLLRDGFCGRHIEGFAAINVADIENIKRAIDLFGGVYIGLGLPLSAQTQDVWDVPAGGATGQGAPNSWGGHAVFCPAYDAGGLTCITWGALKRMTWAFWQAYADEAYAIVAGAWIKSGASPAGIKVSDLVADMAALKA